MQPYVVLEKAAGETPLQCLEQYRSSHPELADAKMAYAGRLDPMASGALLVLLGDACKKQQRYHALDKAYTFSILFGMSSDTGDILGRLTTGPTPDVSDTAVRRAVRSLPRTITLPYPRFSAKTVRGVPLHTWTMQDRLSEITIPEYTATIFRCRLHTCTYRTGAELYDDALSRINRLPEVTEARKALGADFRREDVRADWRTFRDTYGEQSFPVATVSCIVSSGTYMRTLAEVLAEQCGTRGLAFSIHRDTIGHYQPLWRSFGVWRTRYA